ncbi:hypothetical protein LSA03_01910 [Pediococcus argentinicus]|nr:hypothetical protein LSA03_01910 [Pediococcus argentinicus]
MLNNVAPNNIANDNLDSILNLVNKSNTYNAVPNAKKLDGSIAKCETATNPGCNRLKCSPI